MRNLNIIMLFIIFLVSLFALSYRLDEVPTGVYVDEATNGYNAYSILKTGKDEYGQEFPVAFRFFGSYSPPLYAYLTTIPIYFLGLNEYSTRVISVIAGSLMIFVIYLFLKLRDLSNKKIIPLLLLLFIITPWNFFYGRTGYELYLGFFLFSLGALFLWLSLKRSYALVVGLSILSLSTYASHPQIYTTPLLILGFLILFYKQVNKKFLFWGLIVSLLIQIPHLSIINSKVFTNKNDLFYLNEILLASDKIPLPQFITISFSFIYSFFARVITYFSPESLFFFADPDPQRGIPELSVFYNWMVIPYFIGLFVLAKNIKGKFEKFIALLFVVSIIPPSLARDPFSTQRALNLLLPFFILISLGIEKIYEFLKLKKFLALYVIFFGISLILLWRSYFVLLPAERAITWNYGYKLLAEYISKNPDTKFLIDQSRTKPSYIELAFFLKLDPKILQEAADPKIREDYYNSTEFNPGYKFENIETRSIEWKEDPLKEQILVGDELAVSEPQLKDHFLTQIYLISDPRGYPIFKLFQTNPKEKCARTSNKPVFCTGIN